MACREGCRRVREAGFARDTYAVYSTVCGLCSALRSCIGGQVMNALEMEFEDDTFDLVWACESGEHMPDKAKYVQEMTRVLKPGGPAFCLSAHSGIFPMHVGDLIIMVAYSPHVLSSITIYCYSP